MIDVFHLILTIQIILTTIKKSVSNKNCQDNTQGMFDLFFSFTKGVFDLLKNKSLNKITPFVLYLILKLFFKLYKLKGKRLDKN
jgi:hypothetical protein